MPSRLPQLQFENAIVTVYKSPTDAGKAAASHTAKLIRSAIAERNQARIIIATGNSQVPLMNALVEEDIDWQAVEVLHMDEYIGLWPDHPSSFRYWIRSRLEEKVHPGAMHYLNGNAENLNAEILRYTRLVQDSGIDIAFVGFGENGHIAFNDPPAADFSDPATIKVVMLDEGCRRQQAGEGHFSGIDSVPRHAITITCSGLFQARTWICCVPEKRKAEAVRNAFEGPIAETCPASLARRHPQTYVYLDTDSASSLCALSRHG